jgi:hypothetical protein
MLLVAAGCGGASKKPQESDRPASGDTVALEFATCMRSHGVPSFPDPGAPIVPGIKQSPGFRLAMETCNRLYPSSRSTGAVLTEAQRAAALAQAMCIRTHGVPSFPDPTCPGTGGELFPATPGFDPGSAAYRHAAAACGRSGPAGQPHGG